jgi:hypothetical protein
MCVDVQYGRGGVCLTYGVRDDIAAHGFGYAGHCGCVSVDIVCE